MENNRQMKILIVDDDRSQIIFLNDILNPFYQIFAARSGQEALTKIRDNPPDLILLDVIMPDMSGFEVLEALKAHEPTRKIPVIFITGQDSIEDEEKGLLMGAADYITKPFHAAVVCARIKTHLQMADFIRRIEELGLTDPLTGLQNRRSFDQRFAVEWHRAVRSKEPLSLLMLDIDHFKLYNDTYGHLQGDKMLQALANVLASAPQRTVDFSARWGGEEFVVLLPNTHMDGAVVVSERIRKAVEAMSVPDSDGMPTKATISIGVNTIIPVFSDEESTFLAGADEALYAAKREGRNRICVFKAAP